MLLFMWFSSGSFPLPRHPLCSNIGALTLCVFLQKQALTPTLSHGSCDEIFVFARGCGWDGGAGGA